MTLSDSDLNEAVDVYVTEAIDLMVEDFGIFIYSCRLRKYPLRLALQVCLLTPIAFDDVLADAYAEDDLKAHPVYVAAFTYAQNFFATWRSRPTRSIAKYADSNRQIAIDRHDILWD